MHGEALARSLGLREVLPEVEEGELEPALVIEPVLRLDRLHARRDRADRRRQRPGSAARARRGRRAAAPAPEAGAPGRHGALDACRLVYRIPRSWLQRIGTDTGPTPPVSYDRWRASQTAACIARASGCNRLPAYSAAARAGCSPSAMPIASRSTSMPAPSRGRPLGQVAAEGARPRPAVVEAENVPGHVVEPAAAAQMPLDVGHAAPPAPPGATARSASAPNRRAIDLGQQVGVLIGGAAQHHAVDVRQDAPAASSSEPMPPLMHDLELGVRRLQPVDAVVVERRHLAVLLRRQPLQPGLARMHDEGAAAGAGHRVDEALEVRLAVLVVDADAALDRDRHAPRARAWPRRSAPPAPAPPSGRRRSGPPARGPTGSRR